MREFFPVCTGKLTIFLPLSKCQQTTLHSQLYSLLIRELILIINFHDPGIVVHVIHSEDYQRQSQPYILSFAMCFSVPRGHPESPNSMLLFFNWIFSHFLSFFDASLPYDPLLYYSISPLLAVVTRTCHPSFPTTAAFFLPN